MSKQIKTFFYLVLFALVSAPNSAVKPKVKPYRAVALIHGVLTGSESLQLITDRIQEVSKIWQD